jgi:hypothetical protein
LVHFSSLVGSVQEHFKLNQPEDRAKYERMRQELDTKMLPSRDANGFRKLIVSLAACGKLLALHNGDGHVVWSVNFGTGDAPHDVLPWRTPHDVQHAAEVRCSAAGASGVRSALFGTGGRSDLVWSLCLFTVMQTLEPRVHGLRFRIT